MLKQKSAIAGEQQAWMARVHPDDRSALAQALARHLDGTEARFDHEMRLVHKDGSVRHMLSSGPRFVTKAARRTAWSDSTPT